jgi:hypothetical protein
VSATGGNPEGGNPNAAQAGKGSLTNTWGASEAAGANTLCQAVTGSAVGKYTYISSIILSIGPAAAAGSVLATINSLYNVTVDVVLSWSTVQGMVVPLLFPSPLPAATINDGPYVDIPATGVSGPACAIIITGFFF